eukprot:9004167-Karenia_brevis.AAC.1
MRHNFLKFRKAWHPHHEPTVADLRRLLNKWPEAEYAALSREGVHALNTLALQAQFPRRAPLTTIDGDVESWPTNYDEHRRLKTLTKLLPQQIPIHQGMYLYMTRNVHKDLDYVNGMRCVVQ